MDVSVHLRGGENRTDMRSMALAQGLSLLRNTNVECKPRSEGAWGADLVIQTGFGRTAALLDAINQEIPFIIMEAPVFRGYPELPDVHSASTAIYNGLCNGGSWPEAGSEARSKPVLQPIHTEGVDMIFGQKPPDHSLRGSDHIQWLLDKIQEYPDAEVRHHPLMVMQKDQPESILDAVSRCRRAITFNSTAGVEALIGGCEVRAEHWGSYVFDVQDREEWLHRMSWLQWTHGELATEKVARHIMSGYEQAEANARRGLQEIPREKVDGKAICQRYDWTFK